ncbi:anhydro-N-acetylmuramic acid kinase [Litorimonas sp.]|uniref:anhydro-N-acetylmuramic acid kinase n=1 Tax=Litorimonas sp. TaxID=1892381 RepID=UPI003A874C39
MSKAKVMESKRYIALGLMSGTSLDGVDAAVIETDGEEVFEFGKSICIAFPEDGIEVKEAVKTALNWRFEGPPPNKLQMGSDYVDRAHIDAIKALNAQDIDIIGYHGQTVFHQPAQKGVKGQTLQLGNGQSLASKFGVPCVYDFRTADVKAGGQGAPLAPIYHQALCRYSRLEGRIAVVNIGGVSNVTLIDGNKPLIATDCGPGNGPLDSWMELKGARNYDFAGEQSMKGHVDLKRIARWFERDFFKRPIPRSADRYDFDVLADMRDMSLENGAATLASFCAQSISRDLQAFAPNKIIVCGGGRHNPAIMGMLDMHTDGNVLSTEDVGWDGDALEAQAFAYLAVRTVKGLPISFPGTTGVPHPITGGVVARP